MSAIRYQRRDDVLFSDIGDDIVALSVERGQCYGMEKVTAVVWELLVKPLTLDDLCAQLIDLYEVERGQCRAEVSRLLDQLQREGLISAS